MELSPSDTFSHLRKLHHNLRGLNLGERSPIEKNVVDNKNPLVHRYQMNSGGCSSTMSDACEASSSNRDAVSVDDNNLDYESSLEYDTKKIFVSNIRRGVDQIDLVQFFEKFGKVAQVSFLQRKFKHVRWLTAFITFEDAEAARKARLASAEDLTLKDGVMNVSQALSKKKKSRAKKLHLKKSPEVTKASSPSILDLTEDALLHIFSCLSIQDLFVIEDVCCRFSEVVQRTWASKRVLKLVNIFNFQELRHDLDAHYLQKCLRRCKNLLALSFEGVFIKSFDKIPNTIAKCSPQLEYLNLRGMGVTNKGLRAIAEGCKNLKHIDLTDCSRINDSGLTWLFQACQGLEEINLSSLRNISGKKCFRQLGPSVKSLVLKCCFKITADAFLMVAKNCPNLSQLNIRDCHSISNAVFKDLCQKCKNLQSLDAASALNYLSPMEMTSVGLLNGLTDLRLAFNLDLDDNVLRAVGRGCPNLRLIDLTAVNGVTDAGVCCLKSCSKLETLIINHTREVTDVSLKHLAELGSLHTVHAEGNMFLSDAGCIALIISNPNFLELDVSGCDAVTNATLEAALNAVKSSAVRTEKLRVSVGGTSVAPWKLDIEHPLLVISLTDLCTHWLEGDLVGIGDREDDYDCDYLMHCEDDIYDDIYDEYLDSDDDANFYFDPSEPDFDYPYFEEL